MNNTCPTSASTSPDAPSMSAWLSQTVSWTNSLTSNIDVTDTHDIGFLALPFESSLTISGNTSWLPTLSRMSYNLANRFVPAPGVIRSWDFAGSHDDSVLVIIDSMMNMPLLLRSATSYTHNETLVDLVKSHADQIMKHHVRADGSTFHVCDYSAKTGELYLCRTQQGYSDTSTWARGQAWCIHGFTELYTLLGNTSYLDTARRAADYWIAHMASVPDGIPWWDFDTPDPTQGVTPKDVSAAMVAASGLISLSKQLKTRDEVRSASYLAQALSLLQNATSSALASPISWSDARQPASGASTDMNTDAASGDTTGFDAVFLHSTINGHPGTTPGSGGNYDTGLVYADTYYLEAIDRLMEQNLVACDGTINANATAAVTAAGRQNATSAAGIHVPNAGRAGVVAPMVFVAAALI